MPSLRQRVIERLDCMSDNLVSSLQRLVRIPSENPPGRYEEISTAVEMAMQEAGMRTRSIEVPKDVLSRLGLESRRINVIGEYGPKSSKRSLILNAHLDTVPAGDERNWSVKPFSGEIKDGRIYGRGAQDSKGRIASYVTAVTALASLNVELDGKLIVAATCDEETGGLAGAEYLVENGLLKGDYAIVEGMIDELVIAMDGVWQFKVLVGGKAAHAAWPRKGINAIYSAMRLVQAFEQYGEKLLSREASLEGLYPTLTVSMIDGGVKANVIPDSCTLTCDRRVTPNESMDSVRADVSQIIERVRQNVSIQSVELKDVLLAEPYETSPETVLVKIIHKNLKEVTNVDAPIRGLAGFSDARFFANMLKIPTVNFGPGRISDGNAHGPDENVRISDLIAAAKVDALTAMDMLARPT